MAEAQPLESPLPELTVVLFNVHSNDKEVKAADRQQCLGEMLDSVLSEDFPQPLFILCQEYINRPKHKIMCEKLGHKPKSIRCQAEAGVYYRPHPAGKDQLSYVDVSVLRKVDDALILEPNVPFEVSRLMACVLTMSRQAGGQNILLISWHGPETKAKKDPTLKSACFRRLVRFAERLRREESCDTVIIGGDFNLPAQNARQLMDAFRRDKTVDGEVLDKYSLPEDRGKLAIKDFIVCWPRSQLHNLETTVIRPDFRRVKGNRPFDHPVVSYKFGHASEAVAPKGRDPEAVAPKGRDSEAVAPKGRDSEAVAPKGRDPEE